MPFAPHTLVRGLVSSVNTYTKRLSKASRFAARTLLPRARRSGGAALDRRSRERSPTRRALTVLQALLIAFLLRVRFRQSPCAEASRQWRVPPQNRAGRLCPAARAASEFLGGDRRSSVHGF